MATFVLFDENHLVYGARVLVEGMDLGEFNMNPLMLFNHHRTWKGTTDEMLPIGKWENIRKDDERLYADDYYDAHDEFAQKIKNKVEQGILNMASVTLMVISTSDDPSVLVQGQTRPTIVESRIIEASIVDIGRNKGAFKLRRTDESGKEIQTPVFVRLIDESGSEINLKEDNHLLPLLSLKDKTNFDTDMDTRELALSLGLKEDATEAEITAAQKAQAEELQQLRDEKAKNDADLASYRAKEAAETKAKNEAVVDQAIDEKRILAKDKEAYLSLMEKDPENTKAILAKMPVVEKLSTDEGGTGATTDPWALREAEIRANLK